MTVPIRAHFGARSSSCRGRHPAARFFEIALTVAALGFSTAAAHARPGSGTRLPDPGTAALGVIPSVVADGDIVRVELGSTGAPPLLPDPARYSVILRDSEGPVALTQVLEVTPTRLSLRVYVLGRGSGAAEVVIREGITTELVDFEVAVAGGVLTTAGVTWFQGSGERRIAGPVVVLSSADLGSATRSGSLAVHGKAGLDGLPAALGAGDFSTLPPSAFCFPGWRLPIGIEFGCKEIVAKARVKGDDPFEPPRVQPGDGDPRRPKLGAAPLGGDFEAVLQLRFHADPGFAEEGELAAATAAALSRAFGTFGIEAQSAPADEPPAVLFAGQRVHGQGAAALTDLVCVR